MIAFVACNKEEKTTYVADQNGNVTLRMSGENWQNTGKQTYMDMFNRVAFDAGDQVLINGVTATITPCDVNGVTVNADDTPIAYSFYGMMTVAGTVLNGNDYVLYPAQIFTAGTAADMSDYALTMPSNPMFIEANANTELGEDYAWPMGAKLSGNQFLLKNTVAVVTPSIKYGPSFVNALATMTNSPIANEGVDIMTGYNFPELWITGIELVSTDQMLSGAAHVENMATDPTLVMDGTVSGTDVLTVNIPDPIQVEPTGNSEALLGNLTVAPFEAGKHLQMNVTFQLIFPETGHTYDFVYTGSNVELTDTPNYFSILRSKRSTLCANLYQAAAIDKVALAED